MTLAMKQPIIFFFLLQFFTCFCDAFQQWQLFHHRGQSKVSFLLDPSPPLSIRNTINRLSQSHLTLCKRLDVDEEEKRRSDAIGGTGLEGKSLLLLSILISVWFFTVPPAFRRSKLCSEAETAQYPDVCMTAGQFSNRVIEYYQNGGGIQWDFSIAPETKAYYDRYR